MNLNSSPSPTSHTPNNLHKPQSLRILASKRVNWTQALLKHPSSPFPRLRELYDEYLEVLKAAHKQRLMLCMNEAFYHNLQLEKLVDCGSLLMLSSLLSDLWRQPDFDSNKWMMEHLPDLSRHERTVIKASVVTHILSINNDDLIRAIFSNLMVHTFIWQHQFLQDQADSRRRVVDKVWGYNEEGTMWPLITYLATDRFCRRSLDDAVKCYAMLPEVVLDLVFSRASAG